jgi:hypothetical protein
VTIKKEERKMNDIKYEIGSIVADENLSVTTDCKQIQRTDEIILLNEAPVVVTLCFVQLKCRYDVPPPYIKDTGVFVLASNLGPNGSKSMDSCDIGGNGSPIAATTASASCEVKYPNDKTQKVILSTWPEADQGKFYRYVGWRLSAKRANSVTDGELVETLVVEPLIHSTQENIGF